MLMRSTAGIVAVATLLVMFTTVNYAGSLEPTTSPGPTMKTLNQIEPRTAISLPKIFPIKISSPGSYYLPFNITCKDTGSAISIEANDVTLDLCGFTIQSTITTSSYNGISVSGRNVIIKNGHIVSWSGRGIDASTASYCRIEGITSAYNGGYGIAAGKNAAVINCTANNNSSIGICVDANSIVQNCTASENTSAGISASAGPSTISNCIASNNGSSGISAKKATITSCTATRNSQSGIYCDYSTVTNCSANGNQTVGLYLIYSSVTNCSSTDNGDIGIYAAAGSIVQNCTVLYNSSHGIYIMSGSSAINNTVRAHASSSGIYITGYVPAGCRIEGNTVSDNNIGISVMSSNNVVIRNVAIHNTTNNYYIWSSTSGNICPIATSASTDPWVNFSL